jgi:hypothetical protein
VIDRGFGSASEDDEVKPNTMLHGMTRVTSASVSAPAATKSALVSATNKTN